MAVLKASILAGLFAVPLGAMLFVPVWFVLAFISRLATGQVHRATFLLAGGAAIIFAVWVFRMAFEHLRKAYTRSSERF